MESQGASYACKYLDSKDSHKNIYQAGNTALTTLLTDVFIHPTNNGMQQQINHVIVTVYQILGK